MLPDTDTVDTSVTDESDAGTTEGVTAEAKTDKTDDSTGADAVKDESAEG